jgi:hypothetical protein
MEATRSTEGEENVLIVDLYKVKMFCSNRRGEDKRSIDRRYGGNEKHRRRRKCSDCRFIQSKDVLLEQKRRRQKMDRSIIDMEAKRRAEGEENVFREQR